jgi:AraC-like DNA-binding protein
MIELEKALLLVVLSLSGWSLLALLLDRRGHRAINRCFALLLACLGIPLVYFYSRLLAPPDGVFSLALMSQAVIWLKGPFLWAMVQLLTGRLSRFLALHFVPFVLALSVLLFRPDWLLLVGQLGLAQALGYLLLSLYRMLAARRRLGHIALAYPNTTYYWLLWVIAGLLVMLLVDFVLMGLVFFHQILLIEVLRCVSVLISSYLVSIAFFSVYRPQIFFHEGESGELAAFSLSPQEPAASEDASEKAWRELSETVAQQLSVTLTRLMLEEKLYRQGELSLAQLAQALGVSVHQASELLNVHLGVSFYDYLNRYRLEYACKLLRNPRCEWRILDIAFESGFSNKNSFYRYFRAAYGQTPVEYRKRCLVEQSEALV